MARSDRAGHPSGEEGDRQDGHDESGERAGGGVDQRLGADRVGIHVWLGEDLGRGTGDVGELQLVELGAQPLLALDQGGELPARSAAVGETAEIRAMTSVSWASR